MAESKYGKQIVTELKTPAFTPERITSYAQWATRILWMDDKVVDGAFQMNCSWYVRPPATPQPEQSAHTHEADEIIGFFGSNPDDPHDLGGEIEMWLEGEKHVLTKSALTFVPRGMRHWIAVKRVDRPIFHFTTVTAGRYELIRET
ncbi:MAG TPA: hypothetical protein VMT62_13080 [Syntrophorhabdaceae bacterium]|nr:hypothetical protein [Syntrophorhabdaceae bacterium]